MMEIEFELPVTEAPAPIVLPVAMSQNRPKSSEFPGPKVMGLLIANKIRPSGLNTSLWAARSLGGKKQIRSPARPRVDETDGLLIFNGSDQAVA